MLEFTSPILILGDGAWGTTLAVLLAKKNLSVRIWGPFKENLDFINKARENKTYLPGIVLPDTIEAVASLRDALENVDLVILAVPSRFVYELLEQIKGIGAPQNWCIATKGIDFQRYKTMSALVHSVLSPSNIAVLSGPAIAREVVLGLPTALVVASSNQDVAYALQEIFSTEFLRIYRSDDVLGVELGGALKNVIAIASGICDGLGLGTNSKAALLTRGIAEMCRFAQAMGAKPQTLYGVSGVGDLITTAFSPFSRNRSFGEAIGRGENPKKLLKNSVKAIEGAYTVKAVVKMAEELKVDMPISREVYEVVFKGKSPQKALLSLMRRPLKKED